MKILVLFAHPAFHKSNVNRKILEAYSEFEGITFRDLYQEYPEFDIDVQKEQTLLVMHDVIIFQFPLFWYSTPALLKEWQDLVLEHNWAFGSKGNALKDKLFMCSLTVGGPRTAYQIEDFHHHTLNQLLSPLRQTATLCKMKPLPPFVVHGSHGISTVELEEHKVQLVKLLDAFMKNDVKIDELEQIDYMNDYLVKL